WHRRWLPECSLLPCMPPKRLWSSDSGDISLRHRSKGAEPMAEGLRRTFRSAEALRLEEIRHGKHWRRWGPYLSERQWGTVREDYSEYGTAWEYFPHDHAS